MTYPNDPALTSSIPNSHFLAMLQQLPQLFPLQHPQILGDIKRSMDLDYN